MAVLDNHVLKASVGPHEADPPLVIDSAAVLAFPVTLLRFVPVPWRNLKRVERHGSIQLM
nr:hypothetical protein [Kocuria sp.]